MDEIEIPEVIREEIELPKKSGLALSLPIIGVVLLLGIGGLLSALFWFYRPQADPEVVEQPVVQPVAPKPNPVTKPQAKPPKPASVAKPNRGDLLGHLPYNVAPPSSLEPITADGKVKMRAAAAQKFKQMQADARAEGIELTAISAFRSTEAQEELFFGVKEQKVQNAAKRAEVSAPPGYSEHHTGYAVDIGDGTAPTTNVEPTFANTAAFAWLEKNALKYSFEMSFPPGNEQGVSYEPWHWRFVGDRNSLETFYKVRN